MGVDALGCPRVSMPEERLNLWGHPSVDCEQPGRRRVPKVLGNCIDTTCCGYLRPDSTEPVPILDRASGWRGEHEAGQVRYLSVYEMFSQSVLDIEWHGNGPTVV